MDEEEVALDRDAGQQPAQRRPRLSEDPTISPRFAIGKNLYGLLDPEAGRHHEEELV